MNGVEIYDATKAGYEPAMNYGEWRVAYITHSHGFSKEGWRRIERHTKTDEVFVLLNGSARLIIGEEKEIVEMQQGKIYNVTCGTWHHIFADEGSKVLIVENHNTGADNTDYIYLD
ncbi:MAG: hypothetical protein PHE51_03925 [Eubacteriales bacterium]|nr:hypothetical protein [Eubacteriales bacterium]